MMTFVNICEIFYALWFLSNSLIIYLIVYFNYILYSAIILFNAFNLYVEGNKI